eukprot:11178558-Lingulodinium_polyedra.AAC.1
MATVKPRSREPAAAPMAPSSLHSVAALLHARAAIFLHSFFTGMGMPYNAPGGPPGFHQSEGCVGDEPFLFPLGCGAQCALGGGPDVMGDPGIVLV